MLRKKDDGDGLGDDKYIEEAYMTESELKMMLRNKKKQELFNTDIFKKVFNNIVGHQHPKKKSSNKLEVIEHQDPDYQLLMDKLFKIKITK